MAVAITSVIIAGILSIQTPRVQTWLSQKIIGKVTAGADARINFGKIHIKPFNTVIIKDVEVIDKNPCDSSARDTLFSAEYIIARLSLRGLRDKEGIHIGRAYVRGARMNMVIEGSHTNLERMFGIRKDRVKKDSHANVFDIRRAIVNGMTFRLQNFRKDSKDYGEGIDWDDLEVTDINIEARNLKLADKIMSGTLDMLTFREKSGYVCTGMSGSVKAGRGSSAISDLSISDEWSEVHIPGFTMKYSCAQDFKDFIDKIRIEAGIGKSRLSMNTLKYFVPGLDMEPLTMDIDGAEIQGNVSDFSIGRLEARVSGSDASLAVKGRVTGLPDIRSTTADIRIDTLSFTTSAIEEIIASVSGKEIPELSGYAKGHVFRFRGVARGGINSLNVGGVFKSGLGSVVPKLHIKGLLDKDSVTVVSGKLRTFDLDIGKAVGSDIIHECTMNSSLKASFGKEGPRLEIDSLIVDRLNVNGYDYSGIAAAGTLEQDAFDGKIVCSDPNLSFLFQGIFTVSSKTRNGLYKFYANIGYADLNAMNLDKRGMSRISLQTSADFTRVKGRDLLGNIKADNIVLENEHGKYDIGDITVSSHSSDSLYRIKLASDFASGSFIGSGSLPEFIKDFKDLALKEQLPAIYSDSAYVWNGNRYDLSLSLSNTMDLLSFLAPGVYIADNTEMGMSISGDGIIKGKLKSQRLAYREQFIKDLTFDFRSDTTGFSGEMLSETINAATLSLKNNSLKLYAKDNHIGAGFTYDNQGELVNRGELYILGDLSRRPDGKLQSKISLLPSSVYLNAREWSIMPSELTICDKDIDVTNIEFTSGEQSLRIFGGLSDSVEDTLTLDVERFDISIINPLLGKTAAFAGTATGKALLASSGKGKSLSVDFLCDSANISGSRMGTVRMGCRWDNSSDIISLEAVNFLDGKTSFDIKGSYAAGSKEIGASALFSGFDLSCVSAYTGGIFSETSGALSGEFRVSGKTSGLEIESTGARFDNALLRIAFTNVPYTVNGNFRVDSRGVYFDDISLADRFGNQGKVTGEITYENFRDIKFDTRINAERIECINLDEKMSDAFYGNIFATAGISITGPLNSMKMAVEATTTGQGQLHVPVSGSATSSSSDLLTFKQIKVDKAIDPYEIMMSRLQKREKSKSNFEINLIVAATPGIEAFVEIDKSTGNVLSGYGSGTIDLDINPGKDIFNISGDYTLAGGSYRFVTLGFAKDFSINEGSSVKFNGDIMESILDIDATYMTKTSLGTLIADTSSVSTRRLVECGIHISDKISNPRFQFSINVPDIDPTVKARVESALSTEDKVQKQFLSLLVSNSFLPDEQSGIVNNTSLLTSNVSAIMSNQLNNIFQKLDIPLDLGLNYQTNDRGNDIFDVAVSTQLFNNRVIVNGNIGNRQYTSGSTNNDVVGDLDIEIKIDRPGAFRLNLFSHSADQYTNYLDNSQRNGVGLTYQQEFNSFKEFFRKMFSGKKKKEDLQRKEEQALLNEEKVTIKINSDNGSK